MLVIFLFCDNILGTINFKTRNRFGTEAIGQREHLPNMPEALGSILSPAWSWKGRCVVSRFHGEAQGFSVWLSPVALKLWWWCPSWQEHVTVATEARREIRRGSIPSVRCNSTLCMLTFFYKAVTSKASIASQEHQTGN